MIHNYQNSKILLLCYLSECRVDATTQSISARIYTLRNYHKRDMNLKRFFDKCEIRILELYPCKTRQELLQRLQLYQSIFNTKPFGMRYDANRKIQMLEYRRKEKEAIKKAHLMKVPANLVLFWD